MLKTNAFFRECERGFLGVNEENHRRAWELLDLEVRMFSILILDYGLIGQLIDEVKKKSEVYRELKPVYIYRKRALHLLVNYQNKSQRYLLSKLVLAYLKLFALLKFFDKKGFKKPHDYEDPISRLSSFVDIYMQRFVDEFSVDMAMRCFKALNADYKDMDSCDRERYESEDRAVQEYMKKISVMLWGRKDKDLIRLENEYRLELLSKAIKNAYEPVKLDSTMFRELGYHQVLFTAIKLQPGEITKKKFEGSRAKILAMDAPGLELICDEYVEENNSIYIITELKYTKLDAYEIPLDLKHLDSLSIEDIWR